MISSAVVTGGTFIQQNHQIENQHVHRLGGFERLCEAAAPAAFPDRFDPLNCHPDTYTAAIKRIIDWVLGKDDETEEARASVMWLSGAAGPRKAAVAQTIAELCQRNGALLASFSFSDIDPSRNHARSLVATISYQVALIVPGAKDFIVAAIEHDPLILSKSLETQFARLIFEPLKLSITCSNNPESISPHLIVIDSLDECEDEGVRLRILRLLFRVPRESSLPSGIQFLLTSRLEFEIITAVNNSQPLEVAPIRLGLPYSYHRDDDVSRFLRKRFQDIKGSHPHRTHIPLGWPSTCAVEDLIRKSSGQFIYATTVTKYLSSEDHYPPSQLELVLSLATAQVDNPFGDLDALYTHIFSTVNGVYTILRILGLAILGNYPSTELIEGILGLESGEVELSLKEIGALVSVTGTGRATRVEIFHKSLEDFLLDESRSKELHINRALRHAEYAHMCFQHVFKPTTDSITMLILQALIHHLYRGPLTDQRRLDILEFPDMPGARQWVEMEFSEFFWLFLNDFLWIIKKSKWSDARELYTMQKGRFEQLLEPLGPQYAFLMTKY